jgi:hypothetical protein
MHSHGSCTSRRLPCLDRPTVVLRSYSRDDNAYLMKNIRRLTSCNFQLLSALPGYCTSVPDFFSRSCQCQVRELESDIFNKSQVHVSFRAIKMYMSLLTTVTAFVSLLISCNSLLAPKSPALILVMRGDGVSGAAFVAVGVALVAVLDTQLCSCLIFAYTHLVPLPPGLLMCQYSKDNSC